MNWLRKLLGASSPPPDASGGALDYDQMVFLDAEDLAEGGIAKAYAELLPRLRVFVPDPAQIEEVLDDQAPSYAIRYQGRLYSVYDPQTEQESWGRATYVLFHIVNDQLKASTHRFYAINGGNDLGGMFLTQAEVAEAERRLARRLDWPYIPSDEPPSYGQHH